MLGVCYLFEQHLTQITNYAPLVYEVNVRCWPIFLIVNPNQEICWSKGVTSARRHLAISAAAPRCQWEGTWLPTQCRRAGSKTALHNGGWRSRSASFVNAQAHLSLELAGGSSFSRSIHRIYRWIERLNKTACRGSEGQSRFVETCSFLWVPVRSFFLYI